MTTEPQPPQVYTAIAAVIADMTKEGISKASKNTQQGYAFRGIDAVYNALAPKLAAHGLCILPRVVAKEASERESKNGAALLYTRLTVEFDLVSAKDGSKHTICTVGEAMDSADKSSNKAMSAAYKYAAFMAFCIPTEGDNDADATTHEVQSRGATFQPTNGHAPASNGGAPGKASEKQVKALFAIWNANGYEGDVKEWISANYGCGINDLSIKQASDAIAQLKPDEQKAS